MRRRMFLLLPLAALLAACDESRPPPRPLPPIEVCFSPHGRLTETVVREIDAARQTVFVQAYSFTSRPIAAALAQAHRRGVVVHAILDKSRGREILGGRFPVRCGHCGADRRRARDRPQQGHGH